MSITWWKQNRKHCWKLSVRFLNNASFDFGLANFIFCHLLEATVLNLKGSKFRNLKRVHVGFDLPVFSLCLIWCAINCSTMNNMKRKTSYGYDSFEMSFKIHVVEVSQVLYIFSDENVRWLLILITATLGENKNLIQSFTQWISTKFRVILTKNFTWTLLNLGPCFFLRLLEN